MLDRRVVLCVVEFVYSFERTTKCLVVNENIGFSLCEILFDVTFFLLKIEKCLNDVCTRKKFFMSLLFIRKFTVFHSCAEIHSSCRIFTF